MNNPLSHTDLERALGDLPLEERQALSYMWDAVAKADDAPRFDRKAIEKTWEAIRAGSTGVKSAVRLVGAAAGRPPLRRVAPRAWMAIAATLLVGAAGVALWLHPVEHYSPPGEHLAFDLPDGSKVELNSGSRIRYARRFKRTRNVALEGEAYFEVEPGNIPFMVNTFNGTIKVMGTRFNVRSWQESMDPSTIVALESGLLWFDALRDPTLHYEMEPGQLRKIGGRGTSAAENDTLIVRMASAWRDGKMMFNDALLGVAIEDIERHFGIEVLVSSTRLLETRFTLNLIPKDPENVINALSSALGVHYRPTLDGFEIYSPPS